jgi:hypothetical protein
MAHSMKAAATGFALPKRNSRRFGAVICLALFLTLQLFAASSSLHQAIHSDAAAPSHHCVITLVSQGQLNTPEVFTGSLLFVAALLFCLPSVHATLSSSIDYRLSPSRAPPVS